MYPGSRKLSIHRLSSSRLLARRAKRLGTSPPRSLSFRLWSDSHIWDIQTLTLRLSLFSASGSISKLDLVHNPDLTSDSPRLSVGGGRTVPVTVYPRGLPLAGLPSIHNRVVTARARPPARPPLAAVPDRSKGVATSNGVDVGWSTSHRPLSGIDGSWSTASMDVEARLKWRQRRFIVFKSTLRCWLSMLGWSSSRRPKNVRSSSGTSSTAVPVDQAKSLLFLPSGSFTSPSRFWRNRVTPRHGLSQFRNVASVRQKEEFTFIFLVFTTSILVPFPRLGSALVDLYYCNKKNN